jgi:nucleoside-diphosphate-sugar epimerase
MSDLFVFGLGYSAKAAAKSLAAGGWRVSGTVRDAAKAAALEQEGFGAIPFDDRPAVEAALQTATHVLVSTPPGEDGDPALKAYGDALRAAPELFWIGYLSTVGVYGDHGGDWVDEDTPPAAPQGRKSARIEAENAWRALADDHDHIALDIFRLAGIYGPGRSPLDRIRAGDARSIVKPGQVFNRIHVDDIAQTIIAAIRRERRAAVHIFNVADDEPAPPQDVMRYAAGLLGAAPPPEIPYEQAELSAMGRSFYEDNKRVHNTRIKRELGVVLHYPTYREGLQMLAHGKDPDF